MTARVAFIIGAPRSGTTLLERVLSSHSKIQGGTEPHLMTPLAYLGVWSKVDKAPYDHILAAEGLRTFVQQLPHGDADYWAACRAYCDTLYTRAIASAGSKSIYLDKTPEYATVWPFLTKVYPDASYVVLTRHPLAIISSFANSFFDGRYDIAQAHDPILQRYVPAIAALLRSNTVPLVHVRYEDLAATPEPVVQNICRHLGIPFEHEMIEYGRNPETMARKGLGDPIGVKNQTRPSTASIDSWAKEVAAEPDKFPLLQRIVESLDPGDLATLGYPIESFWEPLERYRGQNIVARRRKLNFYRIERKLIVHGRTLVQRTPILARLIRTIRLTCDVLLREY